MVRRARRLRERRGGGRGTLLLALVALRMSAKNPGELSTLDRGILAVVAPAQSAMSSVARAIGGVAGRYAELTHVRPENDRLRSENTRLRAELMQTKRVAAESGRYQLLLGLRDTTPAETAGGARDQHRCLALFPRGARRAGSRRGAGQPRHAGVDARWRRRTHQPRGRQTSDVLLAGRSAVVDRRVPAAHRRAWRPARQGRRERLPLFRGVFDAWGAGRAKEIWW